MPAPSPFLEFIGREEESTALRAWLDQAGGGTESGGAVPIASRPDSLDNVSDRTEPPAGSGTRRAVSEVYERGLPAEGEPDGE